MKKEDIDKIAGILTDMRTSSNELKEAYRKKNRARLNELKKRIRDLQIQIERML